MTYALKDGVTFCVACGRHFFLDRSAGRYFTLAPGDAQRFAGLLALEGCERDMAPLTPGLARLLVVSDGGNLQAFCLEAPPRTGMEDHEGVRPAPLLVLRAALSYLLVRWSLRRLSTGRVLEQLARRDPPQDTGCPDDPAVGRLIVLAAAFEQLRPWIRQDQCLALSLAYVRMAHALGRQVRIVFGITPRPFAAHCWVQLGSQVLNDRVARVATFTPIYAQ